MFPINHIIKTLCIFFLGCPVSAWTQGIRIAAGAYVTANHGNIVTQKNWINNGTFTHNGGYVVFAGSTQEIDGTSGTIFHKLTISAGSNTTILSAGNGLKNILKCNGTLNANNHITLLATATQTALIDGNGAGDVLGNLTMQGYLASGFGYKYLGSPFQSATVNEMADDVNLSAVFPSVYRHDENQASNGWIAYASSSNTLVPMRGYAFQLGNTVKTDTIDMNGVVNNGNISLPLFNNNQTYTKGFNLVSNPYPSPIDWNAATGWTRTQIDNSVYYFNAGVTDQYTGSYSSYVNGISSDGQANNIIPAMQGFFIHVADGSYPVAGSLGLSNTARISVMPQTYRRLNGPEMKSFLRLRAGFAENSISDPTVIYFENSATEKFDTDLDARKLLNTNTDLPSVYSISADAKQLSINSLKEPNSSIHVPLGVLLLKNGQVSFFCTDITALPLNIYCYLYDSVAGVYKNLKDSSRYECYLAAGTYEKRFSVVFSRTAILQQRLPADDSRTGIFQLTGTDRQKRILLNLPPGEKAVIRVINMAGQVLDNREYRISGSYPLLLMQPAGIYQIVCYTGNITITRQIFIGQ
jgi:hypothetical protein